MVSPTATKTCQKPLPRAKVMANSTFLFEPQVDAGYRRLVELLDQAKKLTSANPPAADASATRES